MNFEEFEEEFDEITPLDPQTEQFFEQVIQGKFQEPIMQRKFIHNEMPDGQIPILNMINVLVKVTRLFGGKG